MLIWGGVNLLAPYSISKLDNLKCCPPVYIGPESWMELRGKVYIGSGTIIGPRLKIHTSNHNYNGTMLPYDDQYLIKDIKIGENVWIGSDVTILPGVEIGEGVVIGAGTVVTKSIPSLAIVGGNPVKVIKYRDESHYNNLKRNNSIYLINKKNGKTETKEDKRANYIKKM